jgi:hypothetical protein
MPEPSVTLREWVVDLRGALHHETGHVRFTTPFPDLIEAVGEEFDWRNYAQGDSALHRVWNILEDQRMEAAVVREVPRIANYFTPMVLNIVLRAEPMSWHDSAAQQAVENMGPWIMIAGRHYLPKRLRADARRNFNQNTMGGTAEDWSNIVHRYMRATSADEMMRAVLDAQDFINDINYSSDGNGTSGNDVVMSLDNDRENHDGINTRRIPDLDTTDHEDRMSKAASPKDEGEGEGEGDGTDDGDGADDAKDGDEANDNQPTSSDQPGRGSSDVKDMLKDALDKAMEKASNSSEVNYIVEDITSRIEAGELLNENPDDFRIMSNDDIANAFLLSRDVVDALSEFRTAKSPAWAFRQEEGYLDPLAYRTRERGERDYRRNVQNWNNNGLGVHVSVLADRSGSMSHHMVALSQTIWAINEACLILDIPKTMTLWADHGDTNRVFTENHDPVVFAAGGGTAPTKALDDLANHVENPELHHLVFIFTDGEWMDVDSLTQWKTPDRTFVMIGLNCSNIIRNKDADLVIDIDSMSQLGPEIKRVLEEHISVN